MDKLESGHKRPSGKNGPWMNMNLTELKLNRHEPNRNGNWMNMNLTE